jgi:hypothetical protein
LKFSAVQTPHCFRGACAALGALLAAALGGCYHPSSTPERKASFAPYAGLKLDDPSIGQPVSLEGYLALRSGLLTRAGTTGVSVGSVAAIDSRGYYLTAAHCVEGNDFELQVPCVTVDRSSTPPVAKIEVISRTAEVVWRGDVEKGEPDLAVLCDRRPPDAVFSWGTDPKAGGSVVAAGADYEKRIVDFTAGGLGGKLLGTQTMKSPSGPWTALITSLPAHGGDSGGAVATTDGQLLGITYAVRRGRFSGPRITYAAAPISRGLGGSSMRISHVGRPTIPSLRPGAGRPTIPSLRSGAGPAKPNIWRGCSSTVCANSKPRVSQPMLPKTTARATTARNS